MVSKGKRRKIRTAIHAQMRENVLNRSIVGFSDMIVPESLKYFVYVEICNTKPLVSYVFNADKNISIGRERGSSTICIQDSMISRRHAQVTVQNGYVYVENISMDNLIYIHSFLSETPVYPGRMENVLQNDKVIIGGATMRIVLFRGPEEIVN